MWSRRLGRCFVLLAVTCVGASCATTKLVTANVERVVHGEPIDRSDLHRQVAAAMASDTRQIEAEMGVLRRKFAQAVAQLRANVAKRWGGKDTRIASRTVYVKYTQGYESRVITDFDHGSITIETLDQRDPRGSLQATIVAALLTPNDPSAVDVFTDKSIALDPNEKPYLYGLVHDEHGRPIRTRREAERFARYLIAHRLRTRSVQSATGGRTAWLVRLVMVRNFEALGAQRYRALVVKYSAEYGVSPSLVLAIMRTESNFNPFAVSGAPAYGLMQLVPSTGGRAALERVKGVEETPTPDYLFDPEHNIELGAAYLGVLSHNEFHDVRDQTSRDYCVIAAYNTGARNVTRTFADDPREALDDINRLDSPALFERLRTGLPYEETREYVEKVTLYRRQFVNVATPAHRIAAQRSQME